MTAGEATKRSSKPAVMLFFEDAPKFVSIVELVVAVVNDVGAAAVIGVSSVAAGKGSAAVKGKNSEYIYSFVDTEETHK